MEYNCTELSYSDTSAFSQIVIDYLNGKDTLKTMYAYPVNDKGISMAMEARKQNPVNRKVLTAGLADQYKGIAISEAVGNNLKMLEKDNCYTVCTAHQPALFTGPLYFIYKIFHTIKLADKLKKDYPENEFVPVFFMGSEDADIEELCHFYLRHEKIEWNPGQAGAVGRMKNKGLDKIIERIEQQLAVEPHGAKLLEILKNSFLPQEDIQTGTFRFINSLFAEYGLIIFIPDNVIFKKHMVNIFEDDLLHHTASGIVNNTIEELKKQYQVQANPREINLFYLLNDKRERIEKSGEYWYVLNTGIKFSKEELLKELKEHPENFSPNVILRGLMQEALLPDVAFIGGGGELAYWLELKGVFDNYNIPFPLLILRNSFLLIEPRWKSLMEKLSISEKEVFYSLDKLEKDFIFNNSHADIEVKEEKLALKKVYETLAAKSTQIDSTLEAHVKALEIRALQDLEKLEKKLLKAEKRNNDTEIRQVRKLKAALFPHSHLQERIENFMPYYASYGSYFLKMVYDASLTLEQNFVVVNLQD